MMYLFSFLVGFHVSEKEIYRRGEGIPLAVSCEKDIFDILELPFKPPKLRIG
jgi:hypothetical protein